MNLIKLPELKVGPQQDGATGYVNFDNVTWVVPYVGKSSDRGGSVVITKCGTKYFCALSVDQILDAVIFGKSDLTDIQTKD